MELQQSPSLSRRPDWITIYITYSLQEAHIMAGKLRSDNVPFHIHQEAGS